MLWGLFSKDPFDQERPAKHLMREETVEEKNYLAEVETRCLIPASGFLKKYRIRKKNYETFWLGGIWSKWSSSDGINLRVACFNNRTK